MQQDAEASEFVERVPFHQQKIGSNLLTKKNAQGGI
jgi:hypothetical protein